MDSLVITTIAASTAMAGVAVAGLIILLVARELVDTSDKPTFQLLNRNLLVFATPLLVAFTIIVIMTLAKIIR